MPETLPAMFGGLGDLDPKAPTCFQEGVHAFLNHLTESDRPDCQESSTSQFLTTQYLWGTVAR
jgi:hypothetical protein